MPIVIDDDARKSLNIRYCDNNEVVVEFYDQLWQQNAYLDDVDVSGNLRDWSVRKEGLQLALTHAARNVNTNDGGGESGDWSQYFDHLKTLYDIAEKAAEAIQKAASASSGNVIQIAPMAAYSLTPVYTGDVDPASPGYAGDPRYNGFRGPFRRYGV